MASESVEEKLESFKSILNYLDEADVDKIKTDGMTLRVGGKMLHFSSVDENPITVEEEIRNELKEKLNSQQVIIKNKINNKISEMVSYFNEIKREYQRKEIEMERKLNDTTLMPNVQWNHAERGLSVIKGSGRDKLIWLCQGIYWPKYVDKKPIEKKYSKRLISNVIFLVETKGTHVLDVSTRQPIGLDYFDHYHQSKPDCWGYWKFEKKWNTPDDIIKISKEAEAVLENVNTGSIANSSPRGLPKKNTLLKHLSKSNEEDFLGNLNQQVRRSGITEDNRTNDMDVWSL